MKKLTLFIFALFFLTLVSAQPPVTFNSPTMGYILASVEPPVGIGQNTTTHLHIHVLNNTNSQYVNSSITCFYHLSNPLGQKINEGFLTVSTNSVTANVSYSATINGGNFSTNGLYNVLIECFDGGKFAGITRVLIEVSYAGRQIETSHAILYLIALTILFVLMGLSVYGAVSIPDENPKDDYGQIIGISHLKYLRLPLWGIAYWLFVAISFIISGLARNYLPEASLINLFWVFFRVSFIVGLIAIPVIFIYLIIELFRDKELKGLLERGLPTDG